MAETVILAETTYEGFAPNEMFEGLPALVFNSPPCEVEIGKSYLVNWDGMDYNCTAVDYGVDPTFGQAIAMGQTTAIGVPDGSNDDAPFILGFTSTVSYFIAFDAATSHAVAIYTAAEEETPEGIVLKDRDGNPTTYAGAAGVKMVDTNGEFVTFLPSEVDEATSLPLPVIFFSATTRAMNYNNKSGTSVSVSLNIPTTAQILNANASGMSNAYSSTSNLAKGVCSANPAGSGDYITTVSKGDTAITITASKNSSTLYAYTITAVGLVVIFTMPGIYYRLNGDGEKEIYCDATAMELPGGSSPAPTMAIGGINGKGSFALLDLSASQITTIPGDAFYYGDDAPVKVIFPATIETIGGRAFYNAFTSVLDLSAVTSVPTLGNASCFNANTVTEIRVPASLYDEFTTATNWSTLASKMVAV